MNKKVILAILDGWGISENKTVSAVAKAHTPFIDSLYRKWPHATLRTDGMNVGLPEGQMGNSEVGHVNLGAGRIVYQDLAKINLAVENNLLIEQPELEKAFNYAKSNNKPIHFLGLLSDGGVHSHIDHLKGLLTAADQYGVERKYIHAFTDGRDVDPKSGKAFLEEIILHAAKTNSKLATVIGRYFAMDRDQRWERVKKAYDLLILGKGKPTSNIINVIEESYSEGTTDEFIEPISLTDQQNHPVATIQPDDVVIFYNFRTDRGRQLTETLCQRDFPDLGMKKLPLYYVTMTTYDETFNNVKVVYQKGNVKQTLGEVVANAGKSQIRIAETEKYPHVTFFFSGGREAPFQNEKRIMCNSPKVATYDLKPEMSAFQITDKIIPEINTQTADFICLNFANPDMVGHTGVFEAAVKACETVDTCLERVVEAAVGNDYAVLVIADHGNCDVMINENGSPNTAHTTNPVPVILINGETEKVRDGILGDIAPTILKLMGIEKPEVMTQEPLF